MQWLVTPNPYNILKITKINLGFGLFVKWHLNIGGLYNANVIPEEEQHLNHNLQAKWVYTFPQGY